MNSDPCTVCGGTDVNLVDGFYYCMECGTQDMTIRETIIENDQLIDGRLGVGTKKKIKLKKSKLCMSKEWDKWHAYNFMLCGLVNELITLGARTSFKSKVLWIWTRYIKKYHIRKEYDMDSSRKQNTLINDIDDDNLSEDDKDNEGKSSKSHQSGIRTISYQLLFSILYVGLNLDKSDILLSHMLRYIKEGRLTYHNLVNYVPSEIKASKIPQWREFMQSRTVLFRSFSILRTSYLLINDLELGTPVIPNLKDIANMQVKELCLPKDIKYLVFSLMDYLPINRNHYLKFEHHKMLPDFETIVISYVLLALKLCFGLDDEYDIKLSDAVERINKQECHLKFYRVGISETTDRLFSLREWFTFLEFRKIILCQLYQPLASKHDFNEDNFIVSELLKDSVKQEKIKKEADQLAFELLNTIPQQLPFTIIPKEDFPVSLTPLTTYTEFVLPRIKDSHMRLLLSEDFSKYSIKYAYVNLFLQNSDGDNIVKGVTENNKTFNRHIVGLYKDKPIRKLTMVYVKNADNDNWIQDFLDKNKELENTEKRSKKEFKFHDFVTECSSDSDNDIPLSHIKTENYGVDETDVIKDVEQMKLQSIEELEVEKNIFNDDFDDLKEDLLNKSEEMPELVLEFSQSQIDSLNATKDEIDVSDNFGGPSYVSPPEDFNPFTFNRQEFIKMLILKACQKYKIPIPYTYKDKKPVERKRKIEPSTTPVIAKKRAKTTGYPKHKQIIAAYNALFTEDTSVEEHVLPTSNDTRENFPPENAIDESDQVGHAESDIDKSIEENYNNLTMNDSSLPDDDIIDDGHTEEFDFDLNQFEDDKELMQILDKYIFESETDKSQTIKSLRENILDKRKSNSAVKNTTSLKAEENYEPLIENVNNINEFKYYTRHYHHTIMRHNYMSYTFESDLTENFPKSFKYILMTCANMLEVSSYHLYKYFIHLEKVLLKKVKCK